MTSVKLRVRQRALDIAVGLHCAAAVLLGVFHQYMNPKLSATCVLIAGVVIGFIGLRYHRQKLNSPWGVMIMSIAAVALADVYSLVFYQSADTVSFIVVGLYFAAYILATVAVRGHIKRYFPRGSLIVNLDAAIVAIAIATVIVSLALVKLRAFQLTTEQQVLGLIYPALDIMLLVMLAQLWFSPAANRVFALRLALMSPLPFLFEHLTLLVQLENVGVKELHALSWVYIYSAVLVGWSATRPSTRIQTDHSEPSAASMGKTQVFTLALSLAIPPMALGIFGLLSPLIPWRILATGAITLSVIVLVRIAVLMTMVREQTEQAERMSRSDALTGAANRRRWDHATAVHVQEHTENGGHFWIGLLDLDCFKQYNDTFGHQAGDGLLVEAVQEWHDQLDDDQLLARFGGEEFLVMLPNLSRTQAVKMMSRLRSCVPGDQTCSAGLALWLPGMDLDAVTSAADHALYQAKRDGRDQLVLAELPEGAQEDQLLRSTT